MAAMDTDAMDVDEYDIAIEDAEVEALPHMQETGLQVEPEPAQAMVDSEMPAAYFENLETYSAWPETLNLQGVDDFGPNEPMDYALEHCPERKPKSLRWINDSSVNLEYYTPEDAADALLALTHPEAGDVASIPTQTARKAQSYSTKPNSALTIREANSGDQKMRGPAKDRYRNNPQARAQDREHGRRKPKPQYLDYDGERAPVQNFDESMYDDNSAPRDATRGRRNNDRGKRDNKEVDSYRPSSLSPRESKYGRLRGRSRSASPMSDGDGRLGFAENGTANRHYRSHSRSRGDRRRRSRSREREFRKRSDVLETSRWEKDRAVLTDSNGRWLKNSSNGQSSSFPHKTESSNHRRSDATDETYKKVSLLSRMTKDGMPLVPKPTLASRITRDDGGSNYGRLGSDEPSYDRLSNDKSNYGRLGNDGSSHGRSRNQDPNYGRLKDDYSDPQESNFQEPTMTRRDLASRITKAPGGKRRYSEDNGFNIRGTTSTEGFSIRGAAGGE